MRRGRHLRVGHRLRDVGRRRVGVAGAGRRDRLLETLARAVAAREAGEGETVLGSFGCVGCAGRLPATRAKDPDNVRVRRLSRSSAGDRAGDRRGVRRRSLRGRGRDVGPQRLRRGCPANRFVGRHPRLRAVPGFRERGDLLQQRRRYERDLAGRGLDPHAGERRVPVHELAHRYLHFRWNVTSWLPRGNAGTWCDTQPTAASGVVQTTVPVHGDLIVFSPGACGADAVTGHVAVIDVVDDARAQVTVVEENRAGRRSAAQSCATCYLHVVANDGSSGAAGTGGATGTGGAVGQGGATGTGGATGAGGGGAAAGTTGSTGTGGGAAGSPGPDAGANTAGTGGSGVKAMSRARRARPHARRSAAAASQAAARERRAVAAWPWRRRCWRW